MAKGNPTWLLADLNEGFCIRTELCGQLTDRQLHFNVLLAFFNTNGMGDRLDVVPQVSSRDITIDRKILSVMQR